MMSRKRKKKRSISLSDAKRLVAAGKQLDPELVSYLEGRIKREEAKARGNGGKMQEHRKNVRELRAVLERNRL
jgi:hypothetical protein